MIDILISLFVFLFTLTAEVLVIVKMKRNYEWYYAPKWYHIYHQPYFRTEIYRQGKIIILKDAVDVIAINEDEANKKIPKAEFEPQIGDMVMSTPRAIIKRTEVRPIRKKEDIQKYYLSIDNEIYVKLKGMNEFWSHVELIHYNNFDFDIEKLREKRHYKRISEAEAVMTCLRKGI